VEPDRARRLIKHGRHLCNGPSDEERAADPGKPDPSVQLLTTPQEWTVEPSPKSERPQDPAGDEARHRSMVRTYAERPRPIPHEAQSAGQWRDSTSPLRRSGATRSRPAIPVAKPNRR
jgi:hypothetical protein